MSEWPHDIERQRDLLADEVEEYRKRDLSQDTIRKRLTAERDAARAAITHLQNAHDNAAVRSGVECPTCGRLYAGYMPAVADGVSEAEHLERVERQRAEALAEVERLRALVMQLGPRSDISRLTRSSLTASATRSTRTDPS